MQAIDVIKHALAVSEQATFALIEDMRDACLTSPTSKGGNHPLWILGHLTQSEGMVAHFVLGEPHPLAHWKELFGAGSEPSQDASKYPAFDEVLAKYRDLRARNLKLLDSIGNEGLDRPVTVPAAMQKLIGTVGQVYLMMALHQMNHRGQLADARRTVGRAPLFTP